MLVPIALVLTGFGVFRAVVCKKKSEKIEKTSMTPMIDEKVHFVRSYKDALMYGLPPM